MKNELTWKHSVFIAAAVLLIAGIAFAGVSVAATNVDWSEANINGTGGDFIINPLPDGNISGLYQSDGNPLILNNDMTLDFNYQTVSLVDIVSSKTEAGVIGTLKFGSEAPNLTIKNLIIDGGEIITSAAGAGFNSGTSVVIGCVPIHEDHGKVFFENITIRNVNLNSRTCENVGGFIGSGASCKFYLYNCSVSNSTFRSGYGSGDVMGNSGGVAGAFVSTGNVFFDTDIIIDNCYIFGCSNAGGIVGLHYGSIDTSRGTCLVKNCVIESKKVGSSKNGCTGGIVGQSITLCWISISDAVVENSVIIGRQVGGMLGGYLKTMSGSGFCNIHSSTVKYCTVDGYSIAGGFIGGIPSSGGSKISIDSNSVSNTCVVSTMLEGVAAGFIAMDTST